MELLAVTVAFPALLLLLTTGVGLLVERVSGWLLPGVLVPPVGLAGLVVLTQLTTMTGATAEATPWVALLAGLGGLVVGWPRLRAVPAAVRAEPLPPLVALAAYVIAIAPVLFSGRPTLTGYLLDTTVATQLAGSEHVLAHARDFSMLPDTGYRSYLTGYFGHGYPTGGHSLLGGVGRLTGTDLIWLYQPFLAAMLAFCAPSLWFLARSAGTPRGIAALGALLASVPALVYAYELMGAIKEIALLPLLALLPALLVAHRQWLGRALLAPLPLVLAAAAGVAAVGLAYSAWVALVFGLAVLLGLLLVRERRLTLGRFAVQIAVAIGLFVLAALPTLRDLASSLDLATNLSQGNVALANDPGNLLQPLHAFQVLGTWINGDHRVDPPHRGGETWMLIGLTLAAVVAGALVLARRGAWLLMAHLAGCGAIWWVLTQRGTVWTDAKLIVLLSPLAMLLAVIGAGGLVRSGRRVEGILLAAVLALGVLWSDAVLYHDTNLAPTDRFRELADIGKRFGGTEPTLITDFDEFALYLLRTNGVNAPGYAWKSEDLAGFPYGASPDLDQLQPAAVRRHPLIVLRRSPEHSRPPTGYEPAFEGRWYTVWRRTPEVDDVLGHVARVRDGEATARPGCGAVLDLAFDARSAGGELAVARRPETLVVDPTKTRLSPNFTPMSEGIALRGPGRLDTTVRMPRAGRYRLWFKGDISRPVEVLLDDRAVGEVGYESGGQRNYLAPLTVELRAGATRLAVRRGGGTLRPGDAAPSRIVRMVLEPVDGARTVQRAGAGSWPRVCREQVDWVEALKPEA